MSARSPITLISPLPGCLPLMTPTTPVAEAGRDLVAAEFAQPIGDECRGAMDLVEQFGIFMDIAAPGLNIGLQIGDAVHDGHGNSGLRGWNATPL